MTIGTTVLIVIGGLAAYYTGMIAYDLYLDKLAQANKDEDNEESVDISGEVKDFQPIPINKHDEQDSRNRFENLICAGITAEKASRMMNSIAEGTPAPELESIRYLIQELKTVQSNNQ